MDKKDISWRGCKWLYCSTWEVIPLHPPIEGWVWCEWSKGKIWKHWSDQVKPVMVNCRYEWDQIDYK